MTNLLAPRDNKLMKKTDDTFPNLFNDLVVSGTVQLTGLTGTTDTNVITFNTSTSALSYRSISSINSGTTTTGSLSFSPTITGTINYSLYTMDDGTRILTIIGVPNFGLTKNAISGTALSQAITDLIPSGGIVPTVLFNVAENTGPTPTQAIYIASINAFGQVILSKALNANNAIPANTNFGTDTCQLVYR